MANMEKTMASLIERGFSVQHFATAKEAADYLDSQIDCTTVGIGILYKMRIPNCSAVGPESNGRKKIVSSS